MLRVYLKEMIELTRDKKTLIFTVLLPTLIMPVIFGGFFALSLKITQKANEEVLEFAIIGSANYPAIEAALTDETRESEVPLNFELVDLDPETNADDLINDNTITFAVNRRAHKEKFRQ